MRLFLEVNPDSTTSMTLSNQIRQKIPEIIVDMVGKCNVIVIIGGDGFILASLNKYSFYQKSFYSINAGSVGFLANTLDLEMLISDINNSQTINLNPLEININNTVYYAFNDFSLNRASSQTIHLDIRIDDYQLDCLVGDGVIISTPMGSSGYNYSAGGSILPLTSPHICLTPICPYLPRNYRGSIFDNDTTIKILIKNREKRPAIITWLKIIKNINII